MMRTLIIFGGMIGSVTVAETIDRTKMWTDAEVDAQARKSGEEVVREDGAIAQHAALAKWRENISNCDDLPIDTRIEFLSNALTKICRFNIYQVNERIEIYEMARDKMVSIPDHTKYFTEKIEKAWQPSVEMVRKIEALPEWKAEMEKANKAGVFSKGTFEVLRGVWGDYPEICSKNLGILGHIPSTEAVRALGDYLRERDAPDIKISIPSTGFLAAESLTELISDGPLQTWQADWEDVPKWQQWFDEVKAGKRTFRFVGSDLDYTLDGPADADTLRRIEERNSSTERSSERKKHTIIAGERAEPNKSGPILSGGLIATILLCLAAFAVFLKRRNVA